MWIHMNAETVHEWHVYIPSQHVHSDSFSFQDGFTGPIFGIVSTFGENVPPPLPPSLFPSLRVKKGWELSNTVSLPFSPLTTEKDR